MSTRAKQVPAEVPDAFVGDLVRLRPPLEDDIDHIVAANSDWNALRLAAGGPPLPFRRASVEEWVTSEFDWKRLPFAIDPLDDEVPVVGHIALSQFSFPEAVAMLGMTLHADARGKGYGTDALRLVCGFGFDQLNLHKIALGTWSFNAPAQALYRKVGFVEEGHEREWLYRDGSYHDTVVFGMLASEWREHRGRP